MSQLSESENQGAVFWKDHSVKLYGLLILVGIVLTLLLSYVNYVVMRIQQVYLPVREAGEQVKIEVTTAHLWLEEYLLGDIQVDVDEVWYHLDLAEELLNAMQHGATINDLKIEQVDDPVIRNSLERVDELMQEYRQITERRYHDRDNSVAGTQIDQEYDRLYQSLIDEILEIEMKIEQNMNRNLYWFQITLGMLIMTIIGLIIIVFVVNVQYRRQEINDMQALQHANQQLKQALIALEDNKQKYERSEERYHLLFNAMQEGFAFHEMIYDDDGKPVNYRFLEVNSAFEIMTGLEKHRVVGRTVLEVLPGIESSWIEIYGNVVSSQEPISFENYIAELDRYYSVSAFSPSPNRFATVFADITDIKKSEKYIRDLNKELENKVVDLERSNRELEQFAYIASHDLQEPLRKVLAFGDRIKQRYGDVLGEQGVDYLDRMRRASARMQRMINDLLTFSRIATRGKPFEKLDLKEVVREVISDLEIMLEQTGGSVEVGDLPQIEADFSQMRQLMQNLISNGLKFHRVGVKPLVKVSGEILDLSEVDLPQNEKQFCRILVEDNGIGFNEKYSERIFQPFQRLHGRSEYEGSGIGLAICRKIVERHDGRIDVSSDLDEGSVFIITLPVVQPVVEDHLKTRILEE